MASLLIRGVFKTCPMLLFTKCGTSILSYNEYFPPKIQIKKFFYSQTIKQHAVKSFNKNQRAQVSREMYFLFFCKIFKCSQDEVESLTRKHPRLETMSLPLLEQKVNLMLSYNLPLSLITKNVRPLIKTSYEELSRRLELLQARSLLTDNPVRSQDKVFYFLGCDGKEFDIGYKNMRDELDALEGCANKSERISQIFRCTQKDVDSLITKHPDLGAMSIPLLEQKVNFLLSYNLPLSLITKNVRPWLHTSHEELNRRLELLQARSLLNDNPVRSQDKVFNYLGCDGKQFDIGYKNMCDELDALKGCANKSERIAQIFRCNQNDVDLLITQHPVLETMSIPLLEQKVNLMLSYNIPLSLITKNVRPLLKTPHEELSRRLELLHVRSLLTDNPVRSQDKVFNYLGFDGKQFDIGYKNMCDELDALEGCANKSERIAQIFRCNQKDVDSLITQHPDLGTMSIPLLEQKVNLLLSYNLPLSLITKNVRPLLKTPHEELSRRLELLQASSLLTDNPVRSQDKVFYFLECNGKQFDIGYKNMRDELYALEGCANKSERIAQIFRCSEKDVDSLITQHPDLGTMSIPLLEQKVNLLLSYNLPLSLITKNIRPWLHTSHEELNRRLELLQARSLLNDNPVRSQDKVFNYLELSGKNFDIGYKNMCDELDALKGCANKSERIAQIFHCNQNDVDSLITQHPSLETISIPLLEQKVNLLLSYNIPLSLITKNVRPWLHTSHEELNRKLELLQARSLLTDNPVRSQDKVFNYLGCDGKKFHIGYKNMCDELDALKGCANKSERIAQIFHCNQNDVDSLITQHPSLETISIPLLEQKVNLLLSYNLPLSLITKNIRPWLHTSHKELSRRLELLQASSLLADNPVRSQDKVFNYLECGGKQFDIGYKNMCDELDALEGCTCPSEYLQMRLECDKRTADYLSSSLYLRNIKTNKLKSTLDFFLNEAKLNSEYVIVHRKLFKYSVPRLKQKWDFRQAAGIPVDNYLKLCEKNGTYNRLNADLVALEGCKTKSEYLQKRLKCSKETADKLLSPTKLTGTSTSKIKSVLDVLLSEIKVHPEYILKNSSLFKLSVPKLFQRFKTPESI